MTKINKAISMFLTKMFPRFAKIKTKQLAVILGNNCCVFTNPCNYDKKSLQPDKIDQNVVIIKNNS